MKDSIIAFDPCPHCENHDMCSKCELTFRRNGVIANPCEWISVKDRLPENRELVVTYSTTKRRVGHCDCLKSYVELWGNYDEVTHWLPLPEAPKGGEE